LAFVESSPRNSILNYSGCSLALQKAKGAEDYSPTVEPKAKPELRFFGFIDYIFGKSS
jgi:hypothetical protein